jgi:hypothetical protein
MDLVKSEGNESPVADPSRVMIGMFSLFKEEFKENLQKQFKGISGTHGPCL